MERTIEAPNCATFLREDAERGSRLTMLGRRAHNYEEQFVIRTIASAIVLVELSQLLDEDAREHERGGQKLDHFS